MTKISKPLPLTLYTRVGCHLCEDMEMQLHELLEPGSFKLERLDIDENPALHGRFNVLVPVLMHEAEEICHHFLDLEAVRLVLASYNTQVRVIPD